MNINTKRLYPYCTKQIDFKFSQNKYDFIVDEIPNRLFSNKGNFSILHIKKTYLSTWDLIKYISQTLNIEEHKIGYAGLKDKNATTTQYISVPLMKEKFFDKLNSKQVEVLNIFRDNTKINIGDLLGNKFQISLYEIKDEDTFELFKIISKIQKHGIPNYFGFQRFGKEFDFETAKAIAYGENIVNNKKLEKLQSASYQSYLFNGWLGERMKFSFENNMEKLMQLDGDIISKDTNYITGLLVGRKIIRATKEARLIEEKYDDDYVQIKGYRRDAWIDVKNLSNKYIKDEKKLILNFELPKSSYATVLIENLAMKNFSINDTAKWYQK